jgi:hypothetical protein
MLLRFLPFYSDDDGQTDGGEKDVRASDVLQRYGNTAESALRLAEKLAEAENANYKLREKNRTLRQERDDARGKVPGDGVVTLPKEDAALLESYRAFGKPEDVKKALEANSEATVKLAKLEKAERLRAAAEAAGYKPSVLERLASDLTIEVRPVKDSAPLVVVVADGQETALADYAKQNWGDFLPALEMKASSSLAPDINAGARGNGQTPLITDDDRKRADAHYRHTF